MNKDPKDESGPQENILEEDRSKGSYGHELGSSQTGRGLGAEVWEVGSKRQRGEVTKGDHASRASGATGVSAGPMPAAASSRLLEGPKPSSLWATRREWLQRPGHPASPRRPVPSCRSCLHRAGHGPVPTPAPSPPPSWVPIPPQMSNLLPRSPTSTAVPGPIPTSTPVAGPVPRSPRQEHLLVQLSRTDGPGSQSCLVPTHLHADPHPVGEDAQTHRSLGPSGPVPNAASYDRQKNVLPGVLRSPGSVTPRFPGSVRMLAPSPSPLATVPCPLPSVLFLPALSPPSPQALGCEGGR